LVWEGANGEAISPETGQRVRARSSVRADDERAGMRDAVELRASLVF
jgi:hypothetical protein